MSEMTPGPQEEGKDGRGFPTKEGGPLIFATFSSQACRSSDPKAGTLKRREGLGRIHLEINRMGLWEGGLLTILRILTPHVPSERWGCNFNL